MSLLRGNPARQLRLENARPGELNVHIAVTVDQCGDEPASRRVVSKPSDRPKLRLDIVSKEKSSMLYRNAPSAFALYLSLSLLEE